MNVPHLRELEGESVQAGHHSCASAVDEHLVLPSNTRSRVVIYLQKKIFQKTIMLKIEIFYTM